MLREKGRDLGSPAEWERVCWAMTSRARAVDGGTSRSSTGWETTVAGRWRLYFALLSTGEVLKRAVVLDTHADRTGTTSPRPESLARRAAAGEATAHTLSAQPRL